MVPNTQLTVTDGMHIKMKKYIRYLELIFEVVVGSCSVHIVRQCSCMVMAKPILLEFLPVLDFS